MVPDIGASVEGELLKSSPNNPMQTKGDILVRAKDQGNSSFANAHLADPNRLWPKGIVEFKFWKTFPPGNLPLREASEIQNQEN